MNVRLSGPCAMVVVLSAAVGLAWSQDGQAAETVRFAQSSEEVERYDLLEVTVSVDRPGAANPFTDVAVQGTFTAEGCPSRKSHPAARAVSSWACQCGDGDFRG